MGFADIPFGLSVAFLVGGLVALTWSSDFFVDGAAALARALGISPFVIGLVVIGFGTSAPELCVSAMSGFSGHASLSLGNAYGSCVFNVAVILGVAALIRPLVCKPSVTLFAGPCLAALALFSWALLRDGSCTRGDALALLAVFAVLLPFCCWFEQRTRGASEAEPGREGPGAETEAERQFGLVAPAAKVVVGLAVLVGSSHFLVWGAVDLAKFLGVSDLVIGLTVVAVGTSLPELACAVASAWRGQHEFVLGNIIGSNVFNTLGVVGVAAFLSPLTPAPDGTPAFSPFVLTRDLPVLAAASLSILVFGLNWRRPSAPGRIGRVPAVAWILAFAAYTALMFAQETKGL